MRSFRKFLQEVSLLNEQPPPAGGLPPIGGAPPGIGGPATLPPGGPPLGGPAGAPPPMGGAGGAPPPMGGMPGAAPPGGMPGGGVVKLPELNVWKMLEKLVSGHHQQKH